MTAQPTQSGTASEVFVAFLKLGLTSFGGPIAHIGYFQRELIQRRRWMDEARFAQLVALCQFLPGPASSQLGFAMGLLRAGWSGAVAAFLAFTLPSALLMFAFAKFLPQFDEPVGQAAIHGLKLLAVAVVAQGVVGMAAMLTPDLPRRLVAVAAAAMVLLSGWPFVQLGVIAVGGIAGLWACRGVRLQTADDFAPGYSNRLAGLLLAAFLLLLAIALLPLSGSAWAELSAAFYRAGALVFGGGHVVLPLLDEVVVSPGWVESGEFLAGYGAAQAMPGPLFSFAAFLGARVEGIAGAGIGILAIFAPGLLLVGAALPGWHRLTRHPNAARAIAGVNAAVVGILAAALYDPLWTSAVAGLADFLIALVAFVLLWATRAPVLAVLAWCVVAAIVSRALGL